VYLETRFTVIRQELVETGVFLTGRCVRSIWVRHNLENSKKRLKGLEEKVASEGIILRDAQVKFWLFLV
jgi:hypothetical protein